MQAWIFPIRSRTAVLLAALFVAVTLLVMSGATDAMDQAAVAAAKEAGGNPALDMAVQLATESGDIWYMLGLGILLMILRRTRRVGIALMIILVVSTILAGYIKCGVERERPTEDYEATYLPVGLSRDTFALFCEGGFGASYPSGHALRSVAIAILLAYALHGQLGRGAYLLFCYPAAVSASRVFVLEHYPTDVVGGLILGVLLTGILASQTRLYRIYESKS